MSPELLGQKGYSHQTDVWSLGIVLYELTALKPPFNAFNLVGASHAYCCGTVSVPLSYKGCFLAAINLLALAAGTWLLQCCFRSGGLLVGFVCCGDRHLSSNASCMHTCPNSNYPHVLSHSDCFSIGPACHLS